MAAVMVFCYVLASGAGADPRAKLEEVTRMGRVIVLGSLMTDLVARAPRLPLAGESLLGDEFGTFIGGKGCNQAVAAARMGAHTGLIGRVGADVFGDDFLRALEAEGVEHAHVSRDSAAGTGVSLIVLGPGGQNAIVAIPRANYTLSTEHVAAAFQALLGGPGEPPVFLTQCESSLAAVERGLTLAHAAGCRTILNAAPIPREPLSDALLTCVEILVVNEIEAAALTGMPVDEVEGAHGVAAQLLARGPRQVVLTLGARGFLWCGGAEGGDASQTMEVAASPVHAVDATAAGDAFCGALAAQLAEGRSMVEALRWANAAGALAVTRMGALPSLPRRADIEALFRPPFPS
jgi:ribokinase